MTDDIFDGTEGNRTSLDIELFDVSINTSGDPVLLVSYAPLRGQGTSLAKVDMMEPKKVLPYKLASNPGHAEMVNCPTPIILGQITF